AGVVGAASRGATADRWQIGSAAKPRPTGQHPGKLAGKRTPVCCNKRESKMIDRAAFLADARKLLSRLEQDLRARCDEMPEVGQAVEAEYRRAKQAERTGQALEEW